MCHPKSPFTKLFLTLSLFILFLCTVPVDGQQRIVKGFLIEPGVDLTLANLIGADLAGADLTWANLVRVGLTEADLTEAIYDAATQFSADFGDPQQRGMLITVLSTEDKPVAKLTGDINGDDAVNIFDLVIVAGNFGKS